MDKGYNVTSILNDDECETICEEVWDYLEKLNPNIDRNDSETWRNDNWPPHVHGIFKKYGSHSSFMWKMRTDERLVKLYSDLWGTDRLSVSFDGFALVKPSELSYVRSQAKSKEEIPNWLHCDQGLNMDELSYQSFVTLEDIDEDDACFVCLEGSHIYHDEFFAMKKEEMLRADLTKTARANWEKNKIKWYKLTTDDIEWFRSKGCTYKRVTAKAGSVVLWNSKLIHSGSYPVKGRENKMRWTYKLYITYVPTSELESKVIKKRKNLITDNKMTGHDVRRSTVNQFRTYGKDLSHFKDVECDLSMYNIDKVI